MVQSLEGSCLRTRPENFQLPIPEEENGCLLTCSGPDIIKTN
jgi:hypothetical protein